ncbi:MAG TPA: DUF1801 domain-containing protein [Thermoanaerobaculia bacterium]|nr:DUF1801 domain-containing protein [Thermoanaerobaculia bacterium]
MKAGGKRKVETVNEYLAGLRPGQRTALGKLRRAIRAAAPKAEERISYGIPGYRLDGRMLVWFGAGARHCSFYPGGIVPAFRSELAGYDTSKGTIRFSEDEPLPAALVRRIVKARIAAQRRPAKRRVAKKR